MVYSMSNQHIKNRAGLGGFINFNKQAIKTTFCIGHLVMYPFCKRIKIIIHRTYNYSMMFGIHLMKFDKILPNSRST